MSREGRREEERRRGAHLEVATRERAALTLTGAEPPRREKGRKWPAGLKVFPETGTFHNQAPLSRLPWQSPTHYCRQSAAMSATRRICWANQACQFYAMSLFSSSLNVHTNDVLNDEPADPVVACAQAAEGDLPSRRLCRPRPQWLRGEGEGVTAALKLEAASAVRMRPSGLRPEVRVRTVSDTDCIGY